LKSIITAVRVPGMDGLEFSRLLAGAASRRTVILPRGGQQRHPSCGRRDSVEAPSTTLRNVQRRRRCSRPSRGAIEMGSLQREHRRLLQQLDFAKPGRRLTSRRSPQSKQLVSMIRRVACTVVARPRSSRAKAAPERADSRACSTTGAPRADGPSVQSTFFFAITGFAPTALSISCISSMRNAPSHGRLSAARSPDASSQGPRAALCSSTRSPRRARHFQAKLLRVSRTRGIACRRLEVAQGPT